MAVQLAGPGPAQACSRACSSLQTELGSKHVGQGWRWLQGSQACVRLGAGKLLANSVAVHQQCVLCRLAVH
jgi:hypothetical protein